MFLYKKIKIINISSKFYIKITMEKEINVINISTLLLFEYIFNLN